MINEECGKKKEDESVCCVKSILKTIIETQNKAELPIFQGILPETIPITPARFRRKLYRHNRHSLPIRKNQ